MVGPDAPNATAGGDVGRCWSAWPLRSSSWWSGFGIVVANRQDAGPTQIATAKLAPYGGADVGSAGGTVEVVSEDDQLRLQVDMHDLPVAGAGHVLRDVADRSDARVHRCRSRPCGTDRAT